MDHSILHLMLHSLGSVFAVTSGISLTVLALHARFLIPTIEFKNKLVHNYMENGKFREFDTLHVCLEIFDKTAWNVLSLVCLSICFIGKVRQGPLLDMDGTLRLVSFYEVSLWGTGTYPGLGGLDHLYPNKLHECSVHF